MARCDSAAPTTEQIAPGTSSSRNAMHAIIRFSRYIADLDMRRHHYCLDSCKHAPQSRSLQSHLRATVSSCGLTFVVFLCKRPSFSWL